VDRRGGAGVDFAAEDALTNFEISIRFFLQLAVILAACRFVGYVTRYLGQTQVVGEMIAGVLLGPSLFGWLAPEWQAALFAKPTMTVLYCAAQVGLALYMFMVGLDFRIDLIRSRKRSAISVSLAGIVTPMALGAVIAYLLRADTAVFKPEVALWQNMLFLAAAMSITAFPMLARIIRESRMSGTSLGTLALAAGSSDDAAAWCILAIVLASFRAQPAIALLAIGGGIVYAVTTLTAGRALITRFLDWAGRHPKLEGLPIPAMLTLLMMCAWLTDAIGIYAVFGAFILGAAVPRGAFADDLQQKLEPLTVNLLLPLFFVYSGLNTKINLLNTPRLWGIGLLLLAAAVVGKGVACYAAARLNGEPRREAATIGALMNARGLMELIILNIGRDFGVITDTLFSMMIIMAIATTLMASPLFELLYGRQRDELVAAAGGKSPAMISALE
jgi:Kef-type K+ transport system membrane component KefB